ncbi:YrzI family small protein [Peribacillus sp. SCS-155]
MTLNLLFFTITIKNKTMTAHEAIQEEKINKLRNEYLNKAIMHRNL